MQTISVTELGYKYLTPEGKVFYLNTDSHLSIWLKMIVTVEKATCFIAANRKIVFYPVLLPVELLDVQVHWTRRKALLNEMETFVFNELIEVAIREELHISMSASKELLHGYNEFCRKYQIGEDILPFERVMRTYTNNRPENWRRYSKKK